jgi:prepilin-type N-terminal cleavage/methylation domain-containing protein
MKQQRTAGFTLIELMIVVAIIAIIASVAIPRLMAARLSANESAAISTLRSLTSAQAQVQSSGAVDTDADGSGEYCYFGELSGIDPLRILPVGGGAPALGVVGTDELNPAVLSAAFGNVALARVTRSGYIYQMFLPAATVGAATAGLAEAPNGGAVAGAFPDPDNCEILWACYAWPMNAGQTGNRAFMVNQEGDLLQTRNQGAVGNPLGVYNGAVNAPLFDGAYSAAGDMGSQLSISGAPAAATDSNLWVPVQ